MKSKITKRTVESRLEKGETLRSIAKSFGVTHQALSSRRARWGGKPLRKKGTARPRRTDGTFIDQWGYVMVKTSSLPGAMAYTAQHVLVAEKTLGRPLIRGEVVHHIDGDKQNNDPDNLFVCNRSIHRAVHRSLEVLACQLVRNGLLIFVNGKYLWNENSHLAVSLQESGVSISDLKEQE